MPSCTQKERKFLDLLRRERILYRDAGSPSSPDHQKWIEASDELDKAYPSIYDEMAFPPQTKENPEYDQIQSQAQRIPKHEPMPDERGCVFSVTTIARSEVFGGVRTPAVCTTLDRAREIVETNEGDIWEYSYMLCVIEAVIPDQLYGTNGDHQWWYLWDCEQGKYVPIETPDLYKNRFGYEIG